MEKGLCGDSGIKKEQERADRDWDSGRNIIPRLLKAKLGTLEATLKHIE